MAGRGEVTRTLREFESQLTEAVASMPEAAWSDVAYENGWTRREILAHIASTSGVAGFVLTLARAPAGVAATGAGAYDIDQFNRQQVALREGRSVQEVLAEVRANIDRDAAALEAVPDEVLQQQFRAPWGAEGSVAEVIIESVRGHLATHLADLRAAAAG